MGVCLYGANWLLPDAQIFVLVVLGSAVGCGLWRLVCRVAVAALRG
jgi:hypothetical protein